MFFAYDSNMNKFHALDAKKCNDYFCYKCKEKLILRQGKIMPWHFAHPSNSDCHVDRDMSEWHMRMQCYFDRQYQEKVFELDGKKHRADIEKDGFVLEFQHSPISLDDFENRTKFYLKLGFRVVWIFDANELFENGKLIPSDNNTDYVTYDRVREVDRDEEKIKITRFSACKDPFEFLPLTNFDRKKVSICFSKYSADTNEDHVFNVYWNSPDWNKLLMDCNNNIHIMNGDMKLERLFWSNHDWETFYLSGKDTWIKYRGVKGFSRPMYNCKATNDWAKDCKHCTCCVLIEHNEVASEIHCDKHKLRNIQLDYNAPEVYKRDIP